MTGVTSKYRKGMGGMSLGFAKSTLGVLSLLVGCLARRPMYISSEMAVQLPGCRHWLRNIGNWVQVQVPVLSLKTCVTLSILDLC